MADSDVTRSAVRQIQGRLDSHILTLSLRVVIGDDLLPRNRTIERLRRGCSTRLLRIVRSRPGEGYRLWPETEDPMRAATFSRAGPAQDVIEIGEVAPPDQGSGEGRVRLHAPGCNPTEFKTQIGKQSVREKGG